MQNHTPSMQNAILALQEYWANNGCLIFQPINTEVGAGTANPATLLRSLGDRPWNVAYVEPSIRPDDSRYGINPTRLQCHTQFQVLLKPEPGNAQEIYLGSLEAIGIDLEAHDIRFVEDNWESPALGAWGLGWEVWLDGLEITQFTYFQQVAGMPLKVVAVEITYGLERILMALQKVRHFKDIRYAGNITYGELFTQNELEMSTYYLEKADTERQRKLFQIYAREAEMLLGENLPLPAYTNILKCSHVFNILDARGAISTAERAKAFAVMRRLTKEAAILWVQSGAGGGGNQGMNGSAGESCGNGGAPGAEQRDLASPLLVEGGADKDKHNSDINSGNRVVEANTAKAAGVTHDLDANDLDSGGIVGADRQYGDAVLCENTEALNGPQAIVVKGADNTTRSAKPETVLFEIGVEEIPSANSQEVLEAAVNILTKKLNISKLKFQKFTVDITPRRIVVQIHEVHPKQEDSTLSLRGPKMRSAFTDKGEPTAALVGFLRANNAELDDVVKQVYRNEEYVFLQKTLPGKCAAEVLERIFTDMVLEIRASRNMRWGDPHLTFIRPIRWLVAMRGQRALNIAPSALVSGQKTRVLRKNKSPDVWVSSANNYEEFLLGHGIVLSRERRREIITEAAKTVAKQVLCEIDFSNQPIDEITDLVESPLAVLCSFDKKYLTLPDIVLDVIMKKHQRYITLNHIGSKSISQNFITFANGPCNTEVVKTGNEDVIRARFEDAMFFKTADSKLSPETLHEMLGGLVYEGTLGNYLQKSRRVQKITDRLLSLIGSSGDLLRIARRAASLAKFDLASQMVTEMPDLAGFMAKIYAENAGESAEVAQALEDIEAPRGPGRPLPVTPAGAILSVADRLDQLVALTAVGITSTGSSDPFGIRRCANGLVEILRVLPERYKLNPIDIAVGVKAAAEVVYRDLQESENIAENDNLTKDDNASKSGSAVGRLAEMSKVEELVINLLLSRWRSLALEGAEQATSRCGAEHKTFLSNAVYASQKTVLSDADKTLFQLCKIAKDTKFQELAQSLKRIDRICKNSDFIRNDDALISACEKHLITVFDVLKKANFQNLQDFCEAAKDLPQAVNSFFDNTLVMAPERNIREARLGLLCEIRNWSRKIIAWEYV